MGRGSRGEARCGFAGSEDSSDPIVSVFSTRQQEARSRGQNGGAGWVFGAQGARRGLGAGRGPWRVLHEVALARGRRPGPRDEGGAGPACPAVAFVRPLTRRGAARSRTRGRRGGRVSVRTPWPPPHVKQRKGQLGPWVMGGLRSVQGSRRRRRLSAASGTSLRGAACSPHVPSATEVQGVRAPFI